MNVNILVGSAIILILILILLMCNIYLGFTSHKSKGVLGVHLVSIGWMLFLLCICCRLIMIDLPLELMFEKISLIIIAVTIPATIILSLVYLYNNLGQGHTFFESSQGEISVVKRRFTSSSNHKVIIENSVDPILIYDIRSDSLQANKVAKNYLVEIEQVLLKYKDKWLLDTGEIETHELLLDGIWYQMQLSTIKNSKKEVLGRAIVFHCIDEEKKLQQKIVDQNSLLEQANKQLLQYLGVVDALESETARLNILHEIQWSIVEEIESIIRHIHHMQDVDPWDPLLFIKLSEELATSLRQILTTIRQSVNRLTQDTQKEK